MSWAVRNDGRKRCGRRRWSSRLWSSRLLDLPARVGMIHGHHQLAEIVARLLRGCCRLLCCCRHAILLLELMMSNRFVGCLLWLYMNLLHVFASTLVTCTRIRGRLWSRWHLVEPCGEFSRKKDIASPILPQNEQGRQSRHAKSRGMHDFLGHGVRRRHHRRTLNDYHVSSDREPARRPDANRAVPRVPYRRRRIIYLQRTDCANCQCNKNECTAATCI